MKEDLATILANEDKMLEHLAEEKRKQKEILKQKYNELSKNKEDNPYLEAVFNNYSEHFAEKKNEKEQQYKALEHLLEYINAINASENLTTTLQNECNNDRHLLIVEMDKIKSSIDDL